jgi:hypothetical protein
MTACRGRTVLSGRLRQSVVVETALPTLPHFGTFAFVTIEVSEFKNSLHRVVPMPCSPSAARASYITMWRGPYEREMRNPTRSYRRFSCARRWARLSGGA